MGCRTVLASPFYEPGTHWATAPNQPNKDRGGHSYLPESMLYLNGEAGSFG